MKSQSTRRRGFTLLELLVVMFILVLLAGVVTVVVTKRMEEAKHAKAVADIATLKSAIDIYYLHNKAYPPTLEALRTPPSGEMPKWDGPYIEKPVPDDPWGNPYVYNPKGEHNTDSFDLSSWGADGNEGGEGKNADINNWDKDTF
ncbi:MAG: type II secretion system major pseudopilin GspG [Armatimonadota bacterium]